MKILYVTTIASTMSFFSEHFKMLLKNGYDVELACNCGDKLKEMEVKFGLKIHNIPFSRAPLSSQNLEAYREIRKLVSNRKYDIIHCHTPIAAAITRIAGREARKMGTRIAYTAHGFHFYKGAPFINWIIYYPIEWLCAHLTDVLITINKEDYALARKKFKCGKIVYVPGVGIDLAKFKAESTVRDKKRLELGIPQSAKLILSVGELNNNKNHETVIKAIEGLDVYYAIAGDGECFEQLNNTAKEKGISSRIKLLGFRNDVKELLCAADLFVFPSFREGLPVSLMEAMAMGLPCAVSKIRGNVDLIDEAGGELFDPSSYLSCRESNEKLINRDTFEMCQHNLIKIRTFEVNNVLEQMKKIYKALEYQQ